MLLGFFVVDDFMALRRAWNTFGRSIRIQSLVLCSLKILLISGVIRVTTMFLVQNQTISFIFRAFIVAFMLIITSSCDSGGEKDPFVGKWISENLALALQGSCCVIDFGLNEDYIGFGEVDRPHPGVGQVDKHLVSVEATTSGNSISVVITGTKGVDGTYNGRLVDASQCASDACLSGTLQFGSDVVHDLVMFRAID